MKYVIAAVPFSDNLGDGVIADNLESFLRRSNISDVELCDISYRSEVSTFKSKESTMEYFLKFPQFIRQLIVFMFFSLKYFRVGKKYLHTKLVDCDRLLIGGGQLVSDVDLNFPLKLYFLINMAEKFDIETRVIGVGVANKWNWISKWFMRRVLTSKCIVNISVRDELSKSNLQEHFNISNVEILPDPALMSTLVDEYSYDDRNSGETVVGLGVADIGGLNYSSDIVNTHNDNDIKYISSIVKKNNILGIHVVLFTNGATEDERFLHEYIIPMLKKEGLIYSYVERCKTPAELVKTISGFDFVVAYRLHANIIASSFKIPYFAIGWDNKVISFFKSQNRSDHVFKNLKDIDSSYDEIIASSNESLTLNIEDVQNDYINFVGLNCESNKRA
jgi:polysaccharide pyruvyl transferase WcaK-like protein